MPLRDHFRPPLNQRRSWDELHGQWPGMIVQALNTNLPPQYAASPTVHLGGSVEIDVGTFEYDVPSGSVGPTSNSGGIATALGATTQPTLSVETAFPDVDEYEVRVYDVERGRQLVAAIEVVSPSNKDRPESRRAFVAKCVALLLEKVSVTIVDVVTTRESNLYSELLEFIGQADPSLAELPTPTYAVACRAAMPKKRWRFDAWHRPLPVGQPLPSLPIWLADGLAVTLDLEASYEDTCRVLRIA